MRHCATIHTDLLPRGPESFGRSATRVAGFAVTEERVEHWDREHRLRTSRDYDRVKGRGVAHRGRFCLLLALDVPGEPTQIGFIASKKGVGGAVDRNRARRRLREIVRRHWPEMRQDGLKLAFIAGRAVNSAPHPALVAEVERLLTAASAWSPA